MLLECFGHIVYSWVQRRHNGQAPEVNLPDNDYEDKDDDDGADDNVAMAKSGGFWEIEWGKVSSPSLLMAATWGTYKVLMAFLHFYIKCTGNNLVQLYKYILPN